MSNGQEASRKFPTTNGTSSVMNSAGNGLQVPSSDGFIRIRVITSDNASEVHFRLKPDVALVRMKTAYCKKLGYLNKDELRFVYDGQRITDDDTPNKLEMLDGDVVEIYQERTGGEKRKSK